MKYLIICIAALLVFSCEFRQSVTPEDPSAKVRSSQGIATKKNGLDCAEVFWETKHRKSAQNTFVFGEEVRISFDDVKGLIKKNGKYMPYISLVIVESNGDTVLVVTDIADRVGKSKKKGVELFASFTIGAPFRSNASYTAFIDIKDYNGSGSMDTRFRFKTIPDEHIKTIRESADVQEVYLVDSEKNSAVITGKIPVNHDTHLIMEGLEGFSEENGMCDIGVSMVGTSPTGRVLFEIPDAAKGVPVSSADLSLRMTSPAFSITRPGKGNILVEVTVWDKRSPARVSSSVYLGVEE